jgi:hypothetical protein
LSGKELYRWKYLCRWKEFVRWKLGRGENSCPGENSVQVKIVGRWK